MSGLGFSKRMLDAKSVVRLNYLNEQSIASKNGGVTSPFLETHTLRARRSRQALLDSSTLLHGPGTTLPAPFQSVAHLKVKRCFRSDNVSIVQLGRG